MSTTTRAAMTTMAAAGRRARHRLAGRSERGAIGGAEGLLFGMLILVGGTLMIVSAWAVLDTRMALDAAAREYLRSYTEQTDLARARAAGDRAAIEVLRARGNNPAAVEITTVDENGFGPCALARVQLSSTVHWIHAPLVDALDGIGDSRIRVTHSELIDAHREVIPSAGYNPETTECARS